MWCLLTHISHLNKRIINYPALINELKLTQLKIKSTVSTLSTKIQIFINCFPWEFLTTLAFLAPCYIHYLSYRKAISLILFLDHTLLITSEIETISVPSHTVLTCEKPNNVSLIHANQANHHCTSPMTFTFLDANHIIQVTDIFIF